VNRYKVVQAGNGVWGILDKALFTVDESLEAFAPYGRVVRDYSGFFETMIQDAINLNSGEYERSDFGWNTYIPRKDN